MLAHQRGRRKGDVDRVEGRKSEEPCVDAVCQSWTLRRCVFDRQLRPSERWMAGASHSTLVCTFRFFFMVMGNNIMTSVNHFQPRRCSAGAKRTGLGPNKMVTLNDNGNFECSDEQTKRREDVHTSRDIEGVFSANGKRLAERSWGQLRKQSKRSCCTNTTRNQNYTTTAFIPQKCPQDGLKLNKNWSSAA